MSASPPPTISHASADPRKGKPGQSCAECRRSVFYIFSSSGPARLFARLGTLRSKLKCDRYCSVFLLATCSAMNMGKETFLVSRVSGEVAPPYVQMVSLYVPVWV